MTAPCYGRAVANKDETDKDRYKTEKKKNQLWERARKAMLKLKIKSAIIDHIIQKQSPEILAKNLQDWLAEKKKL